MGYKSVLMLTLLAFPIHALSNATVPKGVLIWFYSVEVKDNKIHGNISHFKQTAGISYSPNIIHQIAPLSPQSEVSKASDDNYYLDLANKTLRVSNERPLFLGQVLEISNSETLFEYIPNRYNLALNKLNYSTDVNKYLTDRADLQIQHQKIIEIRDRLKLDAPNVLDYIRAVDQFVHNQLRYRKPIRPNTAIDLLSMENGWCGEFTKLKLSLLRSAGIPTRGVYASTTGKKGPSVDHTGSSKVHTWLQSYIPEIGWISIPSTRKINEQNQFVRYRGGYYLRAIDLYRHEQDIQKKVYSKTLRRVGGIRGNGMFFSGIENYFTKIQSIISQTLDYKNIPSHAIFSEIKGLPQVVHPLLYWFLISVPEHSINTKASDLFINSLILQPSFDPQMFYIISPALVKLRIANALKKQEIIL